MLGLQGAAEARPRPTQSSTRKNVAITEMDKPPADDDIGTADTAKKFGDLATSDSIFAITRSSTITARHGDTTALVVRGRGAGWVAAYLSNRGSAEDTKGAVNDFKWGEKITR